MCCISRYKIDKISKLFNGSGIPTDCDTERSLNVHPMTQLTALSEYQVSKYILKSPTTTCILNPIPTALLKLCLQQLLSVLTELINKCLKTGTMPSAFKEALVIPLLRIPNADIEFKNF